MIDLIRARCTERFGAPEVVARAPGRVNLIGEHTDYNDGLVFPAAIDRAVVVAARRAGDEVRLWSQTFDEADAFALGAGMDGAPHWSRYVRGVVLALREAGHAIGGFEAAVGGDVPDGVGLSSSAALEVAFVTALAGLFGLGMSPRDVALLAQRAEHLVGVQCGIMDQFASALGARDAALLLDCRDLNYRTVPLRLAEHGMLLAIVDSGVRRELVDSQFNARRAECREAAAAIGEQLGRPVASLREVEPAQFEMVAAGLPALLRARARHVIGENVRLLEGVQALEVGDLTRFGAMMDASHASLRDDYEVSVPPVDRLVALTRALPGVLGARMTGAGFGGCIVNLIEEGAVARLRDEVLPGYAEQTGRTPAMWICRPSAGASLI